MFNWKKILTRCFYAENSPWTTIKPTGHVVCPAPIQAEINRPSQGFDSRAIGGFVSSAGGAGDAVGSTGTSGK